jgi:hypothetical protein
MVDRCQCFGETCYLHLQGGRRWRQQVSPKYWYLSTMLHDIRSQRTMILILLVIFRMQNMCTQISEIQIYLLDKSYLIQRFITYNAASRKSKQNKSYNVQVRSNSNLKPLLTSTFDLIHGLNTQGYIHTYILVHKHTQLSLCLITHITIKTDGEAKI